MYDHKMRVETSCAVMCFNYTVISNTGVRINVVLIIWNRDRLPVVVSFELDSSVNNVQKKKNVIKIYVPSRKEGNIDLEIIFIVRQCRWITSRSLYICVYIILHIIYYLTMYRYYKIGTCIMLKLICSAINYIIVISNCL